MAAQLYKTPTGHMFHAGNIALITVGLPARGKTYFAHKLARYLRWLGIPTEIFSVGDYRRRIIGAKQGHDFFSSQQTASVRLEVANQALEDLIQWINKDGGQVGIYDASNVEESRRLYIYNRLTEARIQVLFVESICGKEEIIEANIRQVKLNSPDYIDIDPDVAVKDFLKRIQGYTETYQSIENKQYSFIKNINVGERIIVNKVKGYLQTRIVYYLMNLHIIPRRIYLCRNGATVNDQVFRTDAPLSPTGLEFASRLPEFMDELRRQSSNTAPLQIWTSPRKRSIGTASNFNHEHFNSSPLTVHQKSHLVEINLGEADGLPDDDLRTLYPEEFELHQKNPYSHRYPRAESYRDLALRLEDILLELEHEREDILIIAHQTVLRCIYAYLLDLDEDKIPFIDLPMNTIIELIPLAYGCKESRFPVPV